MIIKKTKRCPFFSNKVIFVVIPHLASGIRLQADLSKFIMPVCVAPLENDETTTHYFTGQDQESG